MRRGLHARLYHAFLSLVKFSFSELINFSIPKSMQ